MPSRSPAFRTALRGLIAASSLLLLLIGVIHFFPNLSARSRNANTQASHSTSRISATASTGQPELRSLTPVEADVPISGSAVNAPDFFTSTAPVASSAPKSATIELDAKYEFDSEVDAAPLPPVDGDLQHSSPVVQHDGDQFDQRISELERWAAANSAHQLEQQQFISLSERIEVQARGLQDIARRTESVERQVQSLAETDRESPSPISIQTTDEDGQPAWIVHARDASLPEFLARLGESAGLNLVVAPDVTGNISLHLRESDADAVLAAVCRISRCRLSRSGNVVVIASDAVPVIEPRSIAPETISKLYRLKYVTGSDLQPIVQPLLTPELGTFGFASVRARMAQAAESNPPQAILVKDTASVLAEIDRLIIELDRPPEAASNSSTPAALPSVQAPPADVSASQTPGESFDPPLTSENPIRSRD